MSDTPEEQEPPPSASEHALRANRLFYDALHAKADRIQKRMKALTPAAVAEREPLIVDLSERTGRTMDEIREAIRELVEVSPGLTNSEVVAEIIGRFPTG